MPRHLHLDFETFSEVDLRDVGAFRYANDPSTEILCAAMALDDEEPVVWDQVYAEDNSPVRGLDRHLAALENPEVLIYCHHAQFEMAICQALLLSDWGIPCPDLSRFRCTMSFARRACLPAKLETLMEVLGSPVKKDPRGNALIRKFSMMQEPKKPTKKLPQGLPRRRIRPEDEPEAFAEMCQYCSTDVKAEQFAAKALVYFDEPINNRNYSLDAVINARGVPVNLVALRHAQRLIDEETEIVSGKFRELVGFEVTQNARLLEWIKSQGVEMDNLQAETVDIFLEDAETSPHVVEYVKGLNMEASYYETMPKAALANNEVVQALRLKQSIAYASIKKVAKMLECAGPHDNRIRGMLGHHGATTGRWTNQLVQFQNMKRAAEFMAAYAYKTLPGGRKMLPHEPGFKECKAPGTSWSELAYRDICAGESREMMEICYGPVLEVISSCIRHFVEDTPHIRYFIHPESDSHFITEDGSHPGIGDGCLEEVTKDEYDNFAKEVA